jgi:predicted HTH transcriptional regulator
MLPMTGAFALMGGALGLLFSVYHRLLLRHQRVLGFLEAELERGVSSLIADGESEHVEFKAGARWDIERGCVSRAIEDAVTRAIAGFLNHAGGSLLIGVTDDGEICGIDADRRTLRDADRDGYERFIIGLVRTRIGGEACPLVHVTFHVCAGRDVCRVIVEAAGTPTYVHDGATSRLFVRLGNSTRELDVREAMEYVSYRFGRGPKPRQLFGAPA